MRYGSEVNGEALDSLTESFHSEHEKVFGIKEITGHPIECLHWSARAIAKMPNIEIKKQEYGGEDASKD